MRATFKKAAGAGVLAASIITIGSVASAAAPEPTVNACVGKLTGLVRIIDLTKHQSCTGLENATSWNQRGVPGPAGATGAQGPAGPAGPAGGDSNALWARVHTTAGDLGSYTASFVNQRHATEVLVRGDFHYRVTFDRPVDQCAAQVTGIGQGKMTEINYFGLPTNQLDVALYIPDWNSAVASDFVLTVNC
jgi:hypothetical protein